MIVKRQTRLGSILVTVLFMTSILALLVAAVATDSFQSLKSVSQSGRDTQAKYAAYAGLEIALNELRKDEGFVGEELADRHGRLVGNLEGLEKLKYDVLIWNNIQDRDETGEVQTELEDMAGPDGVVVRPDTVYIVSSGSDTVRGEEVLLASMGGTARRIRPVFEDAAFARTKLALSGIESMVDAWDSQGWDAYVAGTFPGGTTPGPGGSGAGGGTVGGGTGGSTGGGMGMTNVADYEATLGTDSGEGRTLRLLDGARLNGHYRVGPGVPDGKDIYGQDGGTSSGSSSAFGGMVAETSYAVTTAQSDDQIAGEAPDTGIGLGESKAVEDTKSTEVPHFQAPVADNDVAGPVIADKKWSKKKDKWGNEVSVPPEPTGLAPGGYESVSVPKDQTLSLTSGVYFFRDSFDVNGGTVTCSGSGPVIIFCGKKATFANAIVNESANTSAMQLCFTDDIQDEEELDATVELLEERLDLGGQHEFVQEMFKNDLSPVIGKTETGEIERRGFSRLEVSGSTQVHGSISGRNLVATMDGGEIFGSIMGNVIHGNNSQIHQDLALKGSNVMAAGGWALEGVHKIR
jgi:hypothetical protein